MQSNRKMNLAMLKCLVLGKLVLPGDTHFILLFNLSQILCLVHMSIPIIPPHCILRNYAEEKCLHLPVERGSQIIPHKLIHRGLCLLFYVSQPPTHLSENWAEYVHTFCSYLHICFTII